ncbi:hypothetical protein [Caulobacter sp. UNC279MFTsu5.1]|uniref:hypothetical protein n=1 Tax=Caulobacter sp. UNC279MFTsu5.1 TaxID=1502775 RepID=UPI0008F38F7B|nr:hypothetical protein [Caulobacter sp. UNC279MFTsu5.1]SFJ47520.1 hypothetical protein SAMN02799626_01878 [Caulobacter sp. UNC279MFTsu5.1]
MRQAVIRQQGDEQGIVEAWRAVPDQPVKLVWASSSGEDYCLANLHSFEQGQVDHLNEWCVISPDPLRDDSVFHTAPDGPAIKTWRDIHLGEGYIYLRSEIMLNSETWTRPATVIITLVQGERTVSKMFVVEQRQPAHMGFYSDGGPISVRVDVLRAPDSPFEGSSVKILAFWPYQPVVGVVGEPRLFDLSTSRSVSSALINCNQGGFMNRMIGLLGVMHTAERSGRRALAWWGPNQHCASHLSDIIDIEASGFARVDGDDFGERAETFTFYAEDPAGASVLPLEALPQNANIHSITPFEASDGITPTHAELGAIFRRFVLHPSIREKLERHQGTDFKKVIGLHIRRPYPSGAFAEQEQAKFKLGEQVFSNLISDLRSSMPQFEHVLLCTNSFETEASLKREFPGYVITNDKDSIDNTSDHVAVQDAVVDQILMSRCAFMFSQSTSIFGMFASAIGRTNMFSLTPQSDLDHYEFWKFEEGRHSDTFSSDRTLSQLIARNANL